MRAPKAPKHRRFRHPSESNLILWLLLFRIGFCNLILSAQAMAEGTADYEKWMTETRKMFVGNYAGCKTIEHNIVAMTEDRRCFSRCHAPPWHG